MVTENLLLVFLFVAISYSFPRQEFASESNAANPLSVPDDGRYHKRRARFLWQDKDYNDEYDDDTYDGSGSGNDAKPETHHEIPTDKPHVYVNSCPNLILGSNMRMTGNCTNAKVNSKCTLSCYPGYILTGTAEYTCKEDFGWDNKILAGCERPCPKLEAPGNGTNSGKCDGTATYSETCTFDCSPGFVLKGAKVFTCYFGYWRNHNPPKCVNTCGAVSVPGAEELEGKCDGSAKAGEKCTVSCPKDYVLRGEKVLVCNQNLEWNNRFPTCELSKCSTLAPVVKAWDLITTWNRYCMRLRRECTEPRDGQVLVSCGPCIAGFQEEPELAGKPDKACIIRIKCNEVQSGNTTWSRYCASLKRVCNEPATSGTTARCGQCLDNFVEDPTQPENLDNACTVRTGCMEPYDSSLAEGPTWTQHCAGQNKECTTKFGVNCGNCLSGFRPGRWPSDPCVSGTNAIVSRLRTILLKPDLLIIHEEESFRPPN